ncbi:hypothetical protein, partial [Bacillus sp. AFS031507]|uniref:hypothetical protein n=1 Tax=Bacillus sp. AFS031507 TaxID=2033496 RepID=UPI001C558730
MTILLLPLKDFFLFFGNIGPFYVTEEGFFSVVWAQLFFFVTSPGSFPLPWAQLFFFVTGTSSFPFPWAQLSFSVHPYINLRKHKKQPFLVVLDLP